MKTSNRFALLFLLVFSLSGSLRAQFPVHFKVDQSPRLEAHAGDDIHVQPGTTVTLGGSPSATGGSPPYTYLWTPPHNLDDTSVAYPSLTVDTITQYTLHVTDTQHCTAYDSLWVSIETSIPAHNRSQQPFSVYPNPLHGEQLTIEAAKGTPGFSVTLLTAKGKEIAQHAFPGEGTHRIPVNRTKNPPGGIYLLKIHQEKTYVFKIIAH